MTGVEPKPVSGPVKRSKDTKMRMGGYRAQGHLAHFRKDYELRNRMFAEYDRLYLELIRKR